MSLEINQNCPCKRIQCERHGNCAACREHHLTKKKYPQACERIRLKEEKKQLKSKEKGKNKT